MACFSRFRDILVLKKATLQKEQALGSVALFWHSVHSPFVMAISPARSSTCSVGSDQFSEGIAKIILTKARTACVKRMFAKFAISSLGPYTLIWFNLALNVYFTKLLDS